MRDREAPTTPHSTAGLLSCRPDLQMQLARPAAGLHFRLCRLCPDDLARVSYKACDHAMLSWGCLFMMYWSSCYCSEPCMIAYNIFKVASSNKCSATGVYKYARPIVRVAARFLIQCLTRVSLTECFACLHPQAESPTGCTACYPIVTGMQLCDRRYSSNSFALKLS